jgi:hypothetical protein
VLTCTGSLTLHKTMIMTVHNQYPDIELESPAYFCNRGKLYEHHIEGTNAGAMIDIDLKFDIDQDELGGILIYEVRKRESIEFDHQSIISAMAARAIGETSEMIRFSILWKIKRFERPKVNTMLIECDNELVSNEDKLAQLYDNIDSRLPNYDRHTWLMCNNTALKGKYDVEQEEGLELKIDISEGVKNEDNIKPIWIDSTRQV